MVKLGMGSEQIELDFSVEVVENRREKILGQWETAVG